MADAETIDSPYIQDRSEQVAQARQSLEESRKNELEQKQFQTGQVTAVNDAIQNVKSPSDTVYFLWYGLTSAIWVADIIAIWFGDAGGIYDALKVPFEVILLVSGPFVSNQIKKINSSADTIDSHSAHMQQKIQGLQTKLSKGLNKLGKMGAPGRKASAVLSKAGDSLKKSPLGVYIAGVIADMIPIIDLLPWDVYGVYKMHKAHKAAYERSVAGINTYRQLQAEELDASNQQQE